MILAAIRDITERKKIQENLIITDRLASIGELASGMAHELNNPLTSVIGFADLLLEKELPADIPHIFISSVTGKGLPELKDILWNALQEQG